MGDYFEFLDDIQTKVYENLRVLVKHETGDDQSKILVIINKLLIKYKEYLKILDSKANKQDETDVLLDIYQSKLASLKEKVRSVQLRTFELKNEKIHQERIQKYHLNDKHFGLDDETARERLFALRGKPKTPEETINDQILLHNKKITTSLQSTRQLMATSILQTELNVDALDQQTKDLKNLNEQYMSFNNLLSKSKDIVNFIEKQDKQDKRRIYMALTFFALCCIWVIWRRILRTPVRIFLWSILKTFRIVTWIFGGSSKGKVDPLYTASQLTSSLANTLELASSSVSSIDEDSTITSILSTATSIILDAVFETDISSILLEAADIIPEIEHFSSMSTILIKSTERVYDEL